MTASLETLVIAAYVFAASFQIPRPGPVGKVSDEEIIALAVAQAITGNRVRSPLPGDDRPAAGGFFPDLPDQTQYNRRLRRLTPWITTVQLTTARCARCTPSVVGRTSSQTTSRRSAAPTSPSAI